MTNGKAYGTGFGAAALALTAAVVIGSLGGPPDPVLLARPCPDDVAALQEHLEGVKTLAASDMVNQADVEIEEFGVKVAQGALAEAHPGSSHMVRREGKCYYILAGDLARGRTPDKAAVDDAASDPALLRELCCSSPQGQPRPSTGPCGCVKCGNATDKMLSWTCRW